MAQNSFRRYFLFSLLAAVAASCKPLPQPPAQGYEVMSPPRYAGPANIRGVDDVPQAMPASAPMVPPAAPVIAVVPNAAKEVKVGLLLPLSGPDAALGQAMLDAATLALFDKYNALSPEQRGTQVTLLPKDTAMGAGEAAGQAIAAGATLLIGPIYSEAVEEVKPVAAGKNIPVLSFSNNRQVAGDGTYLLGFQPDAQMARMGDFLYTHQFQRVSALLPGDPYGSLVSRELITAAARARAAAPQIEFYTPEPGNLDAAITRIMQGYGDPKARPQALVLAESGDALKPIFALLAAQKFDPRATRFVGTGKWDDAMSGSVPGLQGGWFASAEPEGVRNFETRYAAQFGAAPPRLAGLAYDAAALAASLALRQDGFTPAMLTTPGGFTGPVNGLFRLLPDGANQRGLAVLEVQPKWFKVVEPAPKRFN